jgi:hypothetical protein
LDSILSLLEHIVNLGAKWIPDTDEIPRNRRDHLKDIGPDRTVRFFKVMREGGAATVDFLESLLASPSFKKRLGTRLREIEKILRPPPPPPPAQEVIAVERPAKTDPKPPPPAFAELRARAEEVLLDVVRQNPALHFSEREVSETIYAQTARKRLGLRRGDDTELAQIFKKAADKLNGRLKTFVFEVRAGEWRRGAKSFSVRLQDEVEWTTAIREAWKGAKPNAHYLSDAGLRLLELARSGQIDPAPTDERTLTSQIGPSARDQKIEDYLWEVTSKAGIPLRWDATEKRYWEAQVFRIWLDPDEKAGDKHLSGLNPKIKADFTKVTKRDLDVVRSRIQELIIQVEPTGAAPLQAFRITSHREWVETFPGRERVTANQLAAFFSALTFHTSINLQYDFRDKAACWSLTLLPTVDWASSIEALRQELAQPPLAERLGISPDAANLFLWIESLRPEHMLGCYSPIVEDACERRIGISCPWGDAHFTAYLQMLVDEINEKTSYDLRLQPWQDYSRGKSRIRVARKQLDMDDVVRRLRWIAFQRGRYLDAAAVRQLLEGLIEGK